MFVYIADQCCWQTVLSKHAQKQQLMKIRKRPKVRGLHTVTSTVPTSSRRWTFVCEMIINHSMVHYTLNYKEEITTGHAIKKLLSLIDYCCIHLYTQTNDDFMIKNKKKLLGLHFFPILLKFNLLM